MDFKQLKWLLLASFIWSLMGCETQQSTKIIQLSTVTSTDTVKAGTPKGMYLYLEKENAIDLKTLLNQQGYDIENLQGVSIDEIRIKVEIPETNFNPNSIEAFNTSFIKSGEVNTVIESDELSYKERTYVIKVQDELSTLDDLNGLFKLNGGLKLKEKLQDNVVLTTQVFMNAKVRN